MNTASPTLSGTHAGVVRTGGWAGSIGAQAGRRGLARDVALVVGFAALTALCAQVTLPLAGTPVPITLQTLSVVGAGMVMSWRLAGVSMVVYLVLGAAGLPVFADGVGGAASVVGATGGYLLAFPLCQPIVSRAWRTGRVRSAFVRGVAASLVGHAVIFALGCAWLAVWMGVTAGEALAMGFVPFVPGTIIKTLTIASAAGAVCRAR